MSASSLWVTCGIVVHERTRFGPEIRLMRDSGTRSDSPNLEKSSEGAGDAAGGRGGRRRRGLLGGPLEVLLGDAALAAGPLDRGEVDALLARETAHGGAGV